VFLAVFGLLALAPASPAAAGEFSIVPGSFQPRALAAGGSPESRAGAHPDRLQIDFELQTDGTSPRDLVFELPPGFGGNPSAVESCPRATYEADQECPPQSQTGVVHFTLKGGQEAELPIFQLEPRPGEYSSSGTKPGVELPLEMELRPGDFGISLHAHDLPKQELSKGNIELWGIPADHQQGTPGPRRPFLSLPTRCGPLFATFRTRSWEEGAPWLSATSQMGPPLTGCAELSFRPSLALQLDNPVADSTTGMRMDFQFPGEEDADALSEAQLKEVTVAMPAGLTVSPAGAEQLQACDDAQFGLGDGTQPNCPAASRLGTVQVAAPALHEPATGTIYLGKERPGERFRMLVAAPGPGSFLKFVGALHPDPATGRLATTLSDLPQLPIERMTMSLDGGPGGLMASPLACGPAVATARFVPYGDGPAVESDASQMIAARQPGLTCPGPIPFAPDFVARSSNHRAGKPTTLSVALRRQPGEQLPRRFAVTMPAGLSAAIGKLQACSEAAAKIGACPATSRLGDARATLGSSSKPAVLEGSAYAGGPYRGSPFSLVMAFRAAIGSFDLGTFTLRAAAEVNAKTGLVTMATDSLPSTMEGVAARFQGIEFSLDRPGLLRNPTSCLRGRMSARIESESGSVVTPSHPYRVRGCKALPFKPRIRLQLDRTRRLRRGGAVGLRISTRLRPGDANLRSMKFTLPAALKFDIASLGQICSRVDAASASCPPGSKVGIARARTPLLAQPISGAIYVAQPKHHDEPPDLWVSLAGDGMHLTMKGKTAATASGFATKLAGLPDMPLSSFEMRMGGGGDGALELGIGPCEGGHPRRFSSSFVARAQNGVVRRREMTIAAPADCGAGR
jgi:hypothetical protein